MKSFIVRKKEYLNIIKSNPELFLSMVANTKGDKNEQDTMRIILDPKNEKELSIVLDSLSFTMDIFDLVAASSEDELEEISFEDNYGLETIINMVNNIKENDCLDTEKFDYLKDPKTLAKVMYQIFNATLTTKEEASEYMASKCGFDYNNEYEKAMFDLYLEKINTTLSEMKNNSSSKVKDISNSDLNAGSEFFKEFHRLCLKGTNNHQLIEENDPCKRLSKLLNIINNEE